MGGSTFRAGTGMRELQGGERALGEWAAACSGAGATAACRTTSRPTTKRALRELACELQVEKTWPSAIRAKITKFGHNICLLRYHPMSYFKKRFSTCAVARAFPFEAPLPGRQGYSQTEREMESGQLCLVRCTGALSSLL